MVSKLLDELIRGHGFATEIVDDRIQIPALGQTWEAAIVRELDHAVQLDVRIDLWRGRRLVESVTGLGKGQPAYADAITAFANGPFHVVLDAFGVPQGDQVQHETWNILGTPVTATLGPVNVRGKPNGSTVAWFPAFQRFVETSELASGTHWVRVFHAYSDGARAAFEILLDNKPWDEASAALAGADWPTGDGWISVRTFVILRGGIDVTEIAASMFALDDDAVIVRFGDDARLPVSLLPLAFGRALLDGIGVAISQTAIIDGDERILADDRIYRACERHARDIHANGPADLFRALALRSSEVDAVNQALHAGSQPKDLVLSPPMITVR